MLCLRVVDNHVWVFEFALAIQENKILRLLDYDTEVPCGCGASWVLTAPTEQNNDVRDHTTSRNISMK